MVLERVEDEEMKNAAHEISVNKKRPVWLRFLTSKFTIASTVLLCILFMPKMYFIYQTAKIPNIDHPFDIEAFGTVKIKPENNAFVEYQQASLKLVVFNPLIKDDDLYNTLDGDWSNRSQEIIKWLDDNQETLLVWKQGTEKSDFLALQPKDQRLGTDITVIQNMRDIARLSILQGKRLQVKGKMQEAWGWHLATFRSSRHSGKHGSLHEHLMGAAIHMMATKAIIYWANDPQVNAKQLKQAINELTTSYATTEPFSTGVKCEYMVIYNLLENKDSEEYLFHDLYYRTKMFFFSTEPEFSKRVIRHQFKLDLYQIDKPRYLQTTPTSIPGDSLTRVKIRQLTTKAKYARMVLPAIREIHEALLRERTNQGILIVILVVQQYKRDHGCFPSNLTTLVKEKYLTEIPLDAMQTIKSQIQYRHTATQTIVYGLGENGIDDGGNVVFVIDLGNDNDSRADDYGYILEKQK